MGKLGQVMGGRAGKAGMGVAGRTRLPPGREGSLHKVAIQSQEKGRKEGRRVG